MIEFILISVKEIASIILIIYVMLFLKKLLNVIQKIFDKTEDNKKIYTPENFNIDISEFKEEIIEKGQKELNNDNKMDTKSN